MVEVAVTFEEFKKDVFEAVENKLLNDGSLNLREENVGNIIDTLTFLLEEGGWWSARKYSNLEFEGKLLELFNSGALPGLFEDNLNNPYLKYFIEDVEVIRHNKDVSPLEAWVIIFARIIDGDIGNTIAVKTCEYIGEDTWYEVDAKELFDFVD